MGRVLLKVVREKAVRLKNHISEEHIYQMGAIVDFSCLEMVNLEMSEGEALAPLRAHTGIPFRLT